MEQLLASQQKVEELTKENVNLQQKVQELTTNNEQQKHDFDQQTKDFEGRIAQLQQEKEEILKGLDKKSAEEEEREMKVQLPLENWFDMLAFVPRRQLGMLAHQVGDRRFARILQSFLHEHGDITLGRMWIIPPRLDVSSDRPMMRLGNYPAIDLPDWPMPKNVKNFYGIYLKVDESTYMNAHLGGRVLDFLRKFQDNSLLANVNLDLNHGRGLQDHHMLDVLEEVLPLISSIYSIEFSHLIDLAHNSDQESQLLLKTMVVKTRILSIPWYRAHSNLTWEYRLDWCCSWLYTPRDDGIPRTLISNSHIEETDCSSLIDRIKKDFVEANHPVSFFIRLIVPKNSQQEISLNNNKTNEKLVVKVEALNGRLSWIMHHQEKLLMLISRHSSKAATHRIEKDEKEILEWSYGRDRQLYILPRNI